MTSCTVSSAPSQPQTDATTPKRRNLHLSRRDTDHFGRPESPKPGKIDRCRCGSNAYRMTIASVTFYIVVFVFTWKACEKSYGTIGDVSPDFVINQSNQAAGSVKKIALFGERHCGTNWITISLRLQLPLSCCAVIR
jgi:hypothetical protein